VAPRTEKDGGTVDLSQPSAVNRDLHLLVARCFRRADFPGVARWEENRAIEVVAWWARTVALGLEFGTNPIPVSRRENFTACPL
jgi:hypothetical protein